VLTLPRWHSAAFSIWRPASLHCKQADTTNTLPGNGKETPLTRPLRKASGVCVVLLLFSFGSNCGGGKQLRKKDPQQNGLNPPSV
jgi:hypothetical protein